MHRYGFSPKLLVQYPEHWFPLQAADYNKEGRLDKARKFGEAAYDCDIVVMFVMLMFVILSALIIFVCLVLLVTGVVHF